MDWRIQYLSQIDATLHSFPQKSCWQALRECSHERPYVQFEEAYQDAQQEMENNRSAEARRLSNHRLHPPRTQRTLHSRNNARGVHRHYRRNNSGRRYRQHHRYNHVHPRRRDNDFMMRRRNDHGIDHGVNRRLRRPHVENPFDNITTLQELGDHIRRHERNPTEEDGHPASRPDVSAHANHAHWKLKYVNEWPWVNSVINDHPGEKTF